MFFINVEGVDFMPKIFIYLLFLNLISTNYAFAEIRVSEIAKKNTRSVPSVIVLDENSQPLRLGSAFFIDSNGLIVTNHHVLAGGKKVVIKTSDGHTGEVVEIINDDPKLDLSVARTSLKNTTPVLVGNSDNIEVGEEIVTIGNSAGLEGTVSKGIISGIRRSEGLSYIQITAPISPGNSGGPVFNLKGEVIGVSTAYIAEGQNLNFAMPINYIKTSKKCSFKTDALPKSKVSYEGKKEPVKAIDVHYDYSSSNLSRVYFSIENQNDYPISDISILFICRNSDGKVIDYSAKSFFKYEEILPKLAKQTSYSWSVAYFRTLNNNERDWRQGAVEIRILDYKIGRELSPFEEKLKSMPEAVKKEQESR